VAFVESFVKSVTGRLWSFGGTVLCLVVLRACMADGKATLSQLASWVVYGRKGRRVQSHGEVEAFQARDGPLHL
jgi:hypothetical protein